MADDRGHIDLIIDLGNLLEEAREYQFHDFKNRDYAAPKVELHKKLLEIDKKMREGKYDN